MILNDFLRLASRWRDLLSWKEMEPDAPLQRLGELEPCLFLVVFSFLDGASCARCGALFANARSMALEASKENAKFRLEGGGVLLSRWLSSNYAACQVFQQQLDLEIASQHFATIAGRYSLPEYDCTLDIQPTGSFRNYGSQHEMVGQATIAGVLRPSDVPQSSLADVPQGMHVRYICLLDRWYSRTVMDGRVMTPEDLEFCGPGYQTYSVHAWLEPLEGSPFTDGAFMENRPRPTARDGWMLEDNPLRHPWHRSLSWRELSKLLSHAKVCEATAQRLCS